MIDKASIPHQHKGERVIFHLRRHWFIFFKIFLLFAFLCLVPVGVFLSIDANFPHLWDSEIIYAITLIFIISYYLTMVAFILTIWTETYLDVWTVTNERIINREQRGLFNRVVSELDLFRIQDVTAEQKGLLPTLLHYGNVYIQSAGATGRFIFGQIPRPYQVAKAIQKLDERAKRNRRIKDYDDDNFYNRQPNNTDQHQS